MLHRFAFLLCLSTLVLACVETRSVVVADQPRATPPPTLDPFYDALTPHGDWWWNEHYGWVWSPRAGVGWRPYTHGAWAWTADYGWMWTSHEPYGWAVYHYGRWLWLDDVGWVWIPGRIWGPAWVVWRTGPGWVGWAPIGPDVVWVPGRGFVNAAHGFYVHPSGWCFVEHRHMLPRDVAAVVVPPPRNAHLLERSRVIHRPEQDGDRVRNRGIAIEEVEAATGARIVPRRVDFSERADEARQERHDGDVVVVPRARAIERSAGPVKSQSEGRADLIGKSARLPPGGSDADLEERPLPGREEREVEDHFQGVRRQMQEQNAVEDKAPPTGAGREDLKKRHDAELQENDREKERAKRANDKKKVVPRKVPKAKPRPR